MLAIRRRPCDVITGFFTYIAIFGMTAVWILGWMGLSVVVGSFFDLPLRTVSLVGAILGPLGFIVTVMIGVLESRSPTAAEFLPAVSTLSTEFVDDPFA
jgi:hypothetical protein